MNDYASILSNDMLINDLRSVVRSGRVNHAYIFDGERGIGKKKIAFAFAKTLVCDEGGEEACGHCSSCIAFDDGNHPDIFFIDEEKEIKVDTVRQKINREVMTRPYGGKYKVFIINKADEMNVQAQNAFLKTLEEPPQYVVFLLLSRNFNSLLTTVLSRCILFRVRPLPQPMLKNYLMQQGADEKEADTLSHYAGGVAGRALELKNDDAFRELSELAFDICLKIKGLDLIGMYEQTDSLRERKNELDTLLELMYYIFRDALIYKTTKSEQHLIHTTRIRDIQTVCAAFSQRRLMRACDALEEARNRAASNGDIQFVLEEMFYRIKEK